MDNRLNILSWLMLIAMLSMMALHSAQLTAGDPDVRPVAAIDPGFRSFPTVMAMGFDLFRVGPEN